MGQRGQRELISAVVATGAPLRSHLGGDLVGRGLTHHPARGTGRHAQVGDAEVEQPRHTARMTGLVLDEDVIRADLAVDHAHRVRHRQRRRRGAQDRHQVRGRRCPALREPLFQRLAEQAVDDHERRPVAETARVDHRHHVRVMQGRHPLRLVREISHHLHRQAAAPGEDLDHERATARRIGDFEQIPAGADRNGGLTRRGPGRGRGRLDATDRLHSDTRAARIGVSRLAVMHHGRTSLST